MNDRALRVQVRVDGAGEAEIQRVGIQVATLLAELRGHEAGAQSLTLMDALSRFGVFRNHQMAATSS